MFRSEKARLKENLRLQLEILTMMHNNHMMLADDTRDHEASSKHLEIAHLLRQTREQFRALLEIYDGVTKQPED